MSAGTSLRQTEAAEVIAAALISEFGHGGERLCQKRIRRGITTIKAWFRADSCPDGSALFELMKVSDRVAYAVLEATGRGTEAQLVQARAVLLRLDEIQADVRARARESFDKPVKSKSKERLDA